jgi:ferredoxin
VRVLVEPSGVVLDAAQGESVLAAARRHGVEWPTECDADGQCTSCVVTILEGELSPVREPERTLAPGDRLACQARPVTDVVVRREELR